MAVSGKRSTTPDSFGSDGDIKHCCDPCKGEGQNVKAQGYCKDCREYLCSTCFSSHSKTKASRHHKLQKCCDVSDAFMLDDKCQIHDDETIKFFCTVHRMPGCHDCMVIKHRTCAVDFISDKCQGFAESAECDDILKILDSKIQEVEVLEGQIDDKSSKADERFNQALRDIDNFENRMMNQIKAMKMKVVAEAVAMNESTKKVLKTSHERCRTNSSNLKLIQSCLLARPFVCIFVPVLRFCMLSGTFVTT